MAFQSTLPARGATRRRNTPRFCQSDFNPRSPHGERPGANAHQERDLIFQSTLPARGATRGSAFRQKQQPISIHAPRTGSDHFRHALQADQRHFNPRSPHGERLPTSNVHHFLPFISIHAPRTGSDGQRGRKPSAQPHFNPRSPHGERRMHFLTRTKL